MISSRTVSLILLLTVIFTIWHFLPSPDNILVAKDNLSSVTSKSDQLAKETVKAKRLKSTEINPIQTSQPEKIISKEEIKKSPDVSTAVVKKQKRSLNTPDFASIKDVRLKKKTFFEFMYPRIVKANEKVINERAKLGMLKKQWLKNRRFSSQELKTFTLFEKKYREDKNKLDRLSKINNLLEKVDKVPPSLILAQSANESAWGTSRFAKHGNNYFGQWCYRKGCGLVPSKRDHGSTHEVAKFSSVQKSVDEYIFNINVSRSYKDIRKLRQKMRLEGQIIDSLILAAGLSRYSERGKAYVEEIQSMIRFNKLQRYD